MPLSIPMLFEQARQEDRDYALPSGGGTSARKETDPANSALLKARKAIVEPVFGWIKRNLEFRRWTVRGLENVKTQWSLLCTTINLKKLYKYWATGRLQLVPS